MTDNLRRASKTILIIILVVCAISVTINLAKPPKPQIIYIQDPNYVQNIGEAQMRLREQGLYAGKIDYIWGPLMEKGYCDYCAIRTIEGK